MTDRRQSVDESAQACASERDALTAPAWTTLGDGARRDVFVVEFSFVQFGQTKAKMPY